MFCNSAVATDSEPECVFRTQLPMYVEDFRIGEDLLISVGRWVRQDDVLADFDLLVAPMSAGFPIAGLLKLMGAETASIIAVTGDNMLGNAKLTFPRISTSFVATRFMPCRAGVLSAKRLEECGYEGLVSLELGGLGWYLKECHACEAINLAVIRATAGWARKWELK